MHCNPQGPSVALPPSAQTPAHFAFIASTPTFIAPAGFHAAPGAAVRVPKLLVVGAYALRHTKSAAQQAGLLC